MDDGGDGGGLLCDHAVGAVDLRDGEIRVRRGRGHQVAFDAAATGGADRQNV